VGVEGMQISQGRERRSSLQAWIEASSIVAAFLYAFGWIFTARFLARFGVAPEDVGFSFSYLLIRVGFMALAFLSLAAGIFWVLNKLADFSGSTRIRIPRASVRNASQLGVAVLAVVAVVSVARSALVTAAALVLFYGVAWLLARWLSRGAALWATEYYESLDLSMRALLRSLAVVCVAVAAAGLIALPFVAADVYADRVQAGDALRTPVLPGITGLSVPKVEVTTVDGSPVSADVTDGACVHLLGSAGGVVILYDHDADRVLRVPQERVTLQEPCS